MTERNIIMTPQMYRQFMAGLSQFGPREYPPIEDGARILLAIMHFGNNAQMICSLKLIGDICHIREQYGLVGGRIPAIDIVRLIQKYNKEGKDKLYAWAMPYFKERYGIKLYE